MLSVMRHRHDLKGWVSTDIVDAVDEVVELLVLLRFGNAHVFENTVVPQTATVEALFCVSTEKFDLNLFYVCTRLHPYDVAFKAMLPEKRTDWQILRWKNVNFAKLIDALCAKCGSVLQRDGRDHVPHTQGTVFYALWPRKADPREGMGFLSNVKNRLLSDPEPAARSYGELGGKSGGSDKTHAQTPVSILETLTFSYINPVLEVGSKRILGLDDLPAPNTQDAAQTVRFQRVLLLKSSFQDPWPLNFTEAPHRAT